MEEQSLLYTELHLAILDLLKFHEDVLQELDLSGNRDPEHDEKMIQFKRIRAIVMERAHQNFELVEGDKIEAAKLLESRQHVDCETCKQVQKVEIIGEDVDEETGFKRDIVVCTVCGDEFMPMKPNNWDDRIKWGEYVYELLHEFGEEQPEIFEQLKLDIDLSDLNENKSKLSDSHNAVIDSRKKYIEALKAAEESLIPLHDDLLMAKLYLLNYNQNEASA